MSLPAQGKKGNGIVKDTYLLEMKQIDKQFPGVHALDHVNFRVKSGEIHALMGENGAGKSTLMKILTGLYQRDMGDIIFDGKSVSFRNPLDSQKAGISTIYQEINLIPYLSIAENIYLGRETMNRTGIDWKKVNKGAKGILEEMGIEADVTRPLCQYGTAIQQMVAIARALFVKAKLIVMDEPTSSLDEQEVHILFQQMKKMKARGIGIIFISHRLDEIFEICDKITILKDGKFVSEDNTSDLTKLELVSRMTGRDAADVLKRKSGIYESAADNSLLEVKDIVDRTKLRGVSLRIRPGEILGIAGLLGSGRTELAKVIFGDNTDYTGTLLVNGETVKWRTPYDAIGKSFAYCSEDRKAEGIFPHMSVRENMTMAVLPHISRNGLVNSSKQKEIVEYYIKKLNIRTPGPEQIIRNLSGGNQQKVLLARWLCMSPQLIILDEPMRGIDVGAKSEIETLIQEISKSGISVLLISSELEELVRNCHRVVVIHDGKNIGELEGDMISEQNIIQAIAQNAVVEGGSSHAE